VVYAPFLAGMKITASRLNSLLIEETMAWTDLDDIGNFATNFSAAASKPPRMRKLMVMGTEVWEFEGRITVSGSALPANTTTTMFTFDSGYRVTVEHEFATGGSSSDHFPVRLGFMASGTLTASVPTEAAGGTTTVWIDGARITNPV
jgi:hypothetical protein